MSLSLDPKDLPLASIWTLFCYGTRDKWEKVNFKKVGDMKTVADMWSYINGLLPKLDDIDEKLLMFVRDDKSVMMEENKNLKGGFVIKYFLSRDDLSVVAPKQYKPEGKETIFQRIFVDLILNAVGESNIYNQKMGLIGCIEAFSFSLVRDVCRMTIWLNNKFKVNDTKLVPNIFSNYSTRVEKIN